MRVPLCALSLLALSATFANAADTSLETEGLRLTLDPQGAIVQLRVGAVSAGGHPQDGGLWVRQMPDGQLVVVPLDTQARTADLSAIELRVTAQIQSRPGHLLVTGTVEDLRDADRGVDVVFRLPVTEARWWSRISDILAADEPQPVVRRRREKLPPGAAVLEAVEKDGRAQNVLPVACVTDPQSRAGVALAIPPDFPCVFRYAYLPDPGCLELCLPLGLTPHAAGPWKSRAEFRFLVLAVDGQWGLRDALRQYYALFPEHFARRTRSSGLWLFAINSLAQVPDPESYAFWEGPRLTELQQAQTHKIETYPYIIVGQRELTHLAERPKDYDAVSAALRNPPAANRNSKSGEGRWWDEWKWDQVRRWVQQCGLHDPQGRCVHTLRNTNWGGESITFPMNPSPFLPGTADQPTVARSTLEDVEKLLNEHPSLSGIYVDSLASWGSYANYRREHFAAARAPLTHDPAGRVYIPNWMPHVDFLHELRRRIAPRLVFGNGIRPGRAFPAFACDILGVECSTGDTTHRRNLDYYRAVAGSKPFLGLFYYPKEEIPRAVAEAYVQRFVALGLSPEVKGKPWGRHKQRDADLYARFLPIYRRLDLAGWQPVTHLRLADKEIWVERFGTAATELFFTLFNPRQEAVDVAVRPDAKALGLAPNCRLCELVEGKAELPLGATIALPPAALRVVQVSAGR